MYLLVTGSRDWRDVETVEQALHQAHDRLVTLEGPPVLLDGGAKGADYLAESIWKERGLPFERVRADWSRPCIPGRCQPGHRRNNAVGEYCPAAGMYRNEEMVARGPRLCLAFLMPCTKSRCPQRGRHDSHGTVQCVEAAQAAGVTVWPYRA